jgi:YVTN family beta-propeller protein
MTRPLLITITAGLLAVPGVLPRPVDSPRPRQPIALALGTGGKWLYVANQRGSISIIDIDKNQVAGEENVGRRLADLVAAPDGHHLLAVDEAAHELLLLTCEGPAVRVTRRLAVSPYPVGVCLSADGTRGYVLSLWSRRLTSVAIVPPLSDGKDGGRVLEVLKVLDLPFAPRKALLVAGDGKLIVADSFGGRLAVVDVNRGIIESVRELPAHNIRGLALSRDGRRLLIVHQHLSPLAHTTRDDIHWGNVVSNHQRELSLADVLAPRADPLRGERLELLGDAGHGAGDPAGVAVAVDGSVLVALSGTAEIALRKGVNAAWARRPVGRRPTAVVVSADGRRAYVANTFADSVSVVDLPRQKIIAEVALGPPAGLNAADRGERLFYDARLSHEGWFSCHSCHTDGHSNGLRNDNLGDDSYGAPKRVLSLLGTRDTAPWAWNGRMARLEDQIRKSVLTTMHGRPTAEGTVQDLAAYLRSLPPPPALGALRGPADEAARRRGREVFHKHGCESCHAPPAYTTPRTYAVGLSDEVGHGTFNPPALCGVSQGSPYFHDGRAAILRDVFTRFRHQLKLKGEPSAQEMDDLLTFLSSL